jgi:MFS transporter, DHA2 family, multidrug resistance protein
MMLIGMVVAVAASMVAAWSPTIQVLIGARFVGGLGAGMAYPTTLLITLPQALESSVAFALAP